MPFVRLDARVSTAIRRDAGVSFRCTGGSLKPACMVSLRKKFVENIGFKTSDLYEIAVGKGEDAGRIQIRATEKGVFRSRELKSGLIFDLGFILDFGVEERLTKTARADFADGVVTITLPDWGEGADDGDEAEEEPASEVAPEPRPAEPEAVRPSRPLLRQIGETPAAVKPAPPPRQPAPAPAEPKPASPRRGAASVTHNGVTINLTPDNEAISFRGRTMEVSERGALLVEACAKAMPNCIGEKFLIDRIWKTKPQNASAMLEMVRRGLDTLKEIGLEVKIQRGVGFQLVEIGK